MALPVIIGISGKAHSGKDFTAEHIKYSFCSLKVGKMSFADPIRDMLSQIVNVDEIYKSGLKESRIDWLGVSLRELMQTLGTEWGRHHVDEDIWVKIANYRLQTRFYAYDIVVIPDVRFQNEIDFILDNGGVIINIEVDKDKHRESLFSSHESESLGGFPLPEPNPNVFNLYNDFSESYLISLNGILYDLVIKKVYER